MGFIFGQHVFCDILSGTAALRLQRTEEPVALSTFSFAGLSPEMLTSKRGPTFFSYKGHWATAGSLTHV